MATLSGCTLVRNALKLRYPLEPSILSYLPLCDEVVLAYDPDSEDKTQDFVKGLAERYPKIKLLPSKWDLTNRSNGSEISIQSNLAIDSCQSDWVLYVQADEAIHEGDHEAVRAILTDPTVLGATFDRRSFLGTLALEIPTYRARGLLRLFRSGMAYTVGDAMSCRPLQNAKGRILDADLRFFNYSRMGEADEIRQRARSLHGFYQGSEEQIEVKLGAEMRQETAPFPTSDHPKPIRSWYGSVPGSIKDDTRPIAFAHKATSPATLAVLLGPGEIPNIAPFLWSFRGWPGEILVIDDETDDSSAERIAWLAAKQLGMGSSRFRIVSHPLNGDFAAARNIAQKAAASPWVLHADLDEIWDPTLVDRLPSLLAQLEKDHVLVCGFPRANYLDGVLINDVPDNLWTNEGLLAAQQRVYWPPRNRDIQYRLLCKQQCWEGRIHEKPNALRLSPERVVALQEHWILHSKSLDRQRRQDAKYRGLGQKQGMPQPERVAADEPTLRERVLSEATSRLPLGPITIVETGTLRDSSPKAAASDGWSTLHLARILSRRGSPESRLVSIDWDPKNIEAARSVVPADLHELVQWICADSRTTLSGLPVQRIDLLYLDSGDDPSLTLAEFQAALPKLSEESIVVIDDTGEYSAGREGKGTLLIPHARKSGWRVEHRNKGKSRMSILTRPNRHG